MVGLEGKGQIILRISQTAALESRDHVKSGVSAHERPLSPIPITSEDIHIFQSQSQSRPEIVLSFNINNDLVRIYISIIQSSENEILIGLLYLSRYYQ